MKNTMPAALRSAEGLHELTIRQLMRSVEGGQAVVHEQARADTPWDTTALRETSFRTPVMVNGYRIYGFVVYPQPYALIQHENTEFNHPRGGKDHYLEEPLISYTATHLESGREVLLRVRSSL